MPPHPKATSVPSSARSDAVSHGRLLPTQVIARTLSLESGEGARTALLFALLFVASMIFVMGRTARDALFLTRFPNTWIAWMWVGYGVVSSIVAAGYGSLSARFDSERFIIGFTGAAAVSYGLVRALIGADLGWAIAFFYIWAEVIANLVIIQAWQVTNDLHDPRSAKRLFGLIGAGRIVGMLISGFITGAIVRAVGTANLILVIMGWMAVFMVLVRVVGRRYSLPKAGGSASATSAPTATMTLTAQQKRYAALISVMLLLIFVALTIGDYQFKAIAKLAYPKTDDLAAYMAGFYAAMGAVAFVFQVFVTPRILRSLGVLAGLVAMPIAFLASTAGLLIAPTLATGTMLKLSDNGLQYTIHDATMQVLYFAFPPAVRTRVRAVLDAMVKPAGYALGGMALVLLSPGASPGAIAHIGFVVLLLGIGWIATAPLVRRSYVEALRLSLVRRQSDVNEETDVLYDSTVRQVLVDALRSGEPAQVRYAAERLASSDPDTLRAELPPLFDHHHPEVRAVALRHAAALGLQEAAQRARAAVNDPSATVTAAALEALGTAAPENAIDELGQFVSDDARPELRNAAMATLLSHAGLDGILIAGAKLQELIRSQVPADRCDAARILGVVAQPSLARSLRPLMRDAAPEVRRTALLAAISCVSPALVDDLLEALRDHRVSRHAGRALAALGPRAVEPVGDALRNDSTPRIVRLGLPHVLQNIGTLDALHTLLGCIADPDEGVRQKAVAAASRLREALRAPALDPARLRPLIRAEVPEHVALRDGYAKVRSWLWRPLLDAQIRLELRGNIVRILRYCELAYSREHVAAARNAILSGDPARRANALEVLDNVLDRQDRDAILDALSRFAQATAYVDKPDTPGTQAPDTVLDWVRQRDALPGVYRRSVLFEAIGVHGVRNLAPLALPHLGSDHPFMRENALIALAACRPDGWRGQMHHHAESDDCPIVRTYARYVLERNSAGLDPEDDMYTTVEKILFLQSVALFAGVPGQDLMPLARVAGIVRLPTGATVFKAGDPGDSLFVVVHGKVAITEDGKDIALLGEGEAFGEMAILDQEPRAMDAVVREDADLLRVSADDFMHALEDTVEVAAGVIRVLSQRLRQANQRRGVLTDESGRNTIL